MMFIQCKRCILLLVGISAIVLSFSPLAFAASFEADAMFFTSNITNSQIFHPISTDYLSSITKPVTKQYLLQLSWSDGTAITPQISQQLQGIRHRRSREIKAVLNSSQFLDLEHYLRNGNTLDEAISKLELQPNQLKLIKAIMDLSDLKINALLLKSSELIHN